MRFPRRQLLHVFSLLPLSALYPRSGRPASSLAQGTVPVVNTGVIGQVDHGKTTLTAAIMQVCADRYGGEAWSYRQLDSAPQERERGIPLAKSQVEFNSSARRYSHFDCPSHTDHVKNMIIGASSMDAGIVVVSAVDGPMPQTREHILLMRQIGQSHLVVYLNKADLIDDEELLALVELETRELLAQYDFDADQTPFVIGSALKALEGDSSAIGLPSVIKLLEVLDSYIPEPKPAVEKPFLMPVEDVFSISGRGTVVTGYIERGLVKLGDEIEIVGINPTLTTTCQGVEMFRELLDEAQAGQTVGVLLRGIGREEVERGQVLAMPGSIRPHRVFDAEIYILSNDEGGPGKPFFENYRPQFYFHTTDVTGSVELQEGVEMVMPGDHVSLRVTLIAPVAMEKGLRFALREGGRTLGAGVVSKIIE